MWHCVLPPLPNVIRWLTICNSTMILHRWPTRAGASPAPTIPEMRIGMNYNNDPNTFEVDVPEEKIYEWIPEIKNSLIN